MNRLAALLSVAILLSAAHCCADSLVIKYRSGRTQTFQLAEPSQTISSWQFTNAAELPATGKQEGALQPSQPAEMSPARQGDGAANEPAKKDNVRFKWNAKPIPD